MQYDLSSTLKEIVFEPRANKKLNLNFKSKIVYPDYDYTREFVRHDFSDEWNNLGYGRITVDGTKWSISTLNTDKINFSRVLAYIVEPNSSRRIIYAGIIEKDGKAIIWYNREVGPVDGVDIYILEDFILNYKNEQYGTIPLISEIPWGYSGAVTMRIDCDESIASGRDLFKIYHEHNIPFSLAIKTDQKITQKDKDFINEVLEARGAVISHSHTHAENWGGSKESAKSEAIKAREVLKKFLPNDYNFDYVVSPFHQNPLEILPGLVDSGIKGFVGGLIKNDPECLRGRASFIENGLDIFTHSQQCMLHGDCYKDTGLSVYKQSFKNHYHFNTFFGYLDHPFSNYHYGWDSEEQRCKAHDDFISYMKTFPDIWFTDIVSSMRFLYRKLNTKVWPEGEQLKWITPKIDGVPALKVIWNQEIYKIQ